MKKRLAMILLALVMLMTGCRNSSASTDVFTIEKDGESVEAVSMAYAWLYTLMCKDTYETFFGDTFWDEIDENGYTYEEAFKEDMINELKQIKVLALEAAEAGVTLTEEEVELCKSNAAEVVGTIEPDTLKMTGIDEDVYAEYEADFLIYEKYKTELLAEEEITVDADDVRMSDFFILSFLTLDYDEDGNEVVLSGDEKEAQKQKAEQAYAMLKEGKTTDEVAEYFDIDPEECMYVECRTPEDERDETYDAAFEEAAFGLKEGEFSEVTECLDGYYVIKMLTYENEEETAIAMEAEKEERAEEIFAPMLEEILDSYDVTMNEENWDKISFKADIGFVAEEGEETETEE